MRVSTRSPRDLQLARALTLGAVAVVFPAGVAAVFVGAFDRDAVADVIAVVYSVGLLLAFSTAFWPLPGLRSWAARERVESGARLFMLVSYATHLSWELGWLTLHDLIAISRDAWWAYPWWAYIDGGDARYASAEPTLIAMEILSVINGAVGLAGLALFHRRGDRRGVLLCMATAVVHLYSVWLYYLSEVAAGLPNVGEGIFDLGFKFVLANAPWAICPWLVLAWGERELRRQSAPSSIQ